MQFFTTLSTATQVAIYEYHHASANTSSPFVDREVTLSFMRAINDDTATIHEQGEVLFKYVHNQHNSVTEPSSLVKGLVPEIMKYSTVTGQIAKHMNSPCNSQVDVRTTILLLRFQSAQVWGTLEAGTYMYMYVVVEDAMQALTSQLLSSIPLC